MDTLIAQTQLLVVVATVAIIVLTILVSLVLTRLSSILTDVDWVSKKIRTETDLITQDLADLREKLTSWRWLTSLGSLFSNQRSRKKAHETKE